VIKIPESADDLTAEWLGEVLGAQIDSLKVEQVGLGVGLVGELHRLTPVYRFGSGPESVIAKIQAPAPETRFVAHLLSMYKREVAFYEVLQERTQIGSAKCFHSAFDPESQAFVILIEDLGHGRNPNQIDGMLVADMELAVDELARMHGRWWNDESLSDHDWSFRLSDSPYPEAVVVAYQGGWPVVQELFAEDVTDSARALGDRFDELLPVLMSRLSEPPFTMCHGDYRAENMFFLDGQDPALVLVDWQLFVRGRGCSDLAYLVAQSFTTADREEHEQPLVRRYVDGLAAAGITDYGFDAAWTDYRLAVLFSFVYSVGAGGSLNMEDPRSIELCRTMFGRIVRAIEHLNCLELVD
jgi:Ecdysteroid kinase-like family